MRIKSAEALKRKADNNTNNKRAYTVISSLIERNMTLQYIASYLNQMILERLKIAYLLLLQLVD